MGVVESLVDRAELRNAGVEVLDGDPFAISGTAGMGKTSLAVHWAHRVADRFPDGQLYVNLRGSDPRGMDPSEALHGFLDAFKVPMKRLPTSLDAKATLYRSMLSGKRVLVVLDNALDA
ncbi:MAG TPA: ATP-binding protein, partial [Micromonosporaceae bacterium]|nr:ATP-binding protein [Micromonosporaceae bacterium]